MYLRDILSVKYVEFLIKPDVFSNGCKYEFFCFVFFNKPYNAFVRDILKQLERKARERSYGVEFIVRREATQ